MKLLSLTTLLTMGALLVSHHAHSNALFSLENLERERASYLHLITNSTLSADERLPSKPANLSAHGGYGTHGAAG